MDDESDDVPVFPVSSGNFKSNKEGFEAVQDGERAFDDSSLFVKFVVKIFIPVTDSPISGVQCDVRLYALGLAGPSEPLGVEPCVSVEEQPLQTQAHAFDRPEKFAKVFFNVKQIVVPTALRLAHAQHNALIV